MKYLLALAAVAALSATALAQPGRGGFGPPAWGGFGPQTSPRGGSEVEQLKAQLRELSAKIDRLSSRAAPTTRPAPTPPPPARGNSDAVARQFDKIIEELRALKGMVTGGNRGGMPGFGGPGGGGRPGDGRGPGGGFGGFGGFGGPGGGDRGPRR